MSNQPSTAPDWQRWPVAMTQTWPVPAVPQEVVRWRQEGLVAAFVAAYSAILGGVAGVLWPRVAPHIELVDAINGSEAASKALLGDDMWLAGLGLLAAVICVGLLALGARGVGAGPGGALGLAVGGLLGSLVAAHVGQTIQQPHIAANLRSAFPGITHSEVGTILGYFGWRVRARFVLLVWPVAALVLHAGGVGLREWRQARQREQVLGAAG